MVVATLASGACRPEAKPEAQRGVAWHRLGSWSGRGSTQTESFLFEGNLRVRWETLNQQSGRTGKFRLLLLSAVSGRQLAVAADQPGIGKGESYISETPHQAYVLIESSDVDWSFTLDEGVMGTIQGPS